MFPSFLECVPSLVFFIGDAVSSFGLLLLFLFLVSLSDFIDVTSCIPFYHVLRAVFSLCVWESVKSF